MPAELELDHANRVVRTRFWDLVTAADLFALSGRIKALFADGTLDATWKEFLDCREVTRTELVPAEAVREIASHDAWPATARRVILAPVASVFGVSRMYQLLTGADDAHARVVRTEAEAIEFLSLGHRSGASEDRTAD